MSAVNHYLQDHLKKPRTAIQRLIASYISEGRHLEPVTLGDYMNRLIQLPTFTDKEKAVNQFVPAAKLATGDLRFFGSAKPWSKLPKSKLEEQVSIPKEIILLCYEAKPRPISFALNAYGLNDFIAYIYQDIAMNDMDDLPEGATLTDPEVLAKVKLWLQQRPDRDTTNSPIKHIRRRLTASFIRSPNQLNRFLFTNDSGGEVSEMACKLLERDDDQGYTRGDLRDFPDVRDDFNVLVEFVLRNRYAADSPEIEEIERVCCPSLVTVPFHEYRIERMRGRGAYKERLLKEHGEEWFNDYVAAQKSEYLERARERARKRRILAKQKKQIESAKEQPQSESPAKKSATASDAHLAVLDSLGQTVKKAKTKRGDPEKV